VTDRADAAAEGAWADEAAGDPPPDRRPARLALLALGPLAALGLLLVALIAVDPLAPLRDGVPPVEDLTVERVRLSSAPRELVATVVNGGPEPVTIAQVLVDDAFWPHEISPGAVIEPLRSAAVRIPYPWVEGEPHSLVILTSTGLSFEHTIGVAVATPVLSVATLTTLAFLGTAAALAPVAIGLGWYPLVRRVGPALVTAFLAFTGGVLAFLAVDASVEAVELAAAVPAAFNGLGIFVLGVVAAVAALLAVRALLPRPTPSGGASTAVFVAVGMGLHNFGEGLALGAAYALGEIALTALLLVGFAVHNSTEGLAIAAPLAERRVRLGLLVGLALVAGGPAIPGTWLGALAWSPALAVAFLGLGVGAIVQVLAEIGSLVRRRSALDRPVVLVAGAAGLAVMYLTSLLAAT